MDRLLNGWQTLRLWMGEHPWLTGLALGFLTAAILHFGYGSRWGYVLPFALVYLLGVGFWRWVRSGSGSPDQTAKAIDRARATDERTAETVTQTPFGR